MYYPYVDTRIHTAGHRTNVTLPENTGEKKETFPQI